MKKGIVLIVMLFAIMSMGCMAQETAGVEGFRVMMAKDSKLTAEQQESLKKKIEQALARNKMSGGESAKYIIEPTVRITNTSTTEGTVTPMTVVEGELVLIAKAMDGKMLNELTVEIQTVTSDEDVKNVSRLIKAVKPTDKKIVRFLKVTQSRIKEL